MEDWLDSLKKDIEKFHNSEYAKKSQWQIDASIHMENVNKTLSSEKRSEARKIKISKSKVLEAQSKFDKIEDISEYLGVTQTTYRRLCREYEIYQNKNVNKTHKVCEHCGLETDLANYNAYHGDFCKIKLITKDDMLNAISKFNFVKDIIKYLGLKRKDYDRLCKKFNISVSTMSPQDKGKLGAKKTSKKVLAWKVDKSKEDFKGEYLGEFNSKSKAAEILKCSRVLINDTISGKYKSPTKFVFEEVE